MSQMSQWRKEKNVAEDLRVTLGKEYVHCVRCVTVGGMQHVRLMQTCHRSCQDDIQAMDVGFFVSNVQLPLVSLCILSHRIFRDSIVTRVILDIKPAPVTREQKLKFQTYPVLGGLVLKLKPDFFSLFVVVSRF